MGYHDAVGRERKMVLDAVRFINDRARLEIALRHTLAAIGIAALEHDFIVSSIKQCDLVPLDLALSKIAFNPTNGSDSLLP